MWQDIDVHHVHVGVHRDKKSVSDLLELQLQAVVNCWFWCWELILDPLQEQQILSSLLTSLFHIQEAKILMKRKYETAFLATMTNPLDCLEQWIIFSTI